ncbi:hypothetical protein GvMRE_I2g28 [endosymbiont GvMRE of Glomus versiforme]|nr:hypothetical protein GvMRE_I2g28 [endosymbiont GvMRE of Glomus versiforme]
MALRLGVYFVSVPNFEWICHNIMTLEVSKDLFEEQIKREIKPLTQPKETVSRLRKYS